MEFTTEPQTQAVKVSFWRPKEPTFSRDITGTVWLSDINLRAVNAFDLVPASGEDAVTTLSQAASELGRQSVREGRARAAIAPHPRARLFLATIFAASLGIRRRQPWAWVAMTILAMLALALWAGGWIERGVLKLSWSNFYLLFLALIGAGGDSVFRPSHFGP